MKIEVLYNNTIDTTVLKTIDNVKSYESNGRLLTINCYHSDDRLTGGAIHNFCITKVVRFTRLEVM